MRPLAPKAQRDVAGDGSVSDRIMAVLRSEVATVDAGAAVKDRNRRLNALRRACGEVDRHRRELLERLRGMQVRIFEMERSRPLLCARCDGLLARRGVWIGAEDQSEGETGDGVVGMNV